MAEHGFFKHIQHYLDSNKTILIKLVLLVAFVLLLHFNQLAFVAEWLNMASLYHHNQSYLSNVRVLATTDILNFTELLAATEIARSSTVGVSFFASFNVDIGNMLHSFAMLLEKGVGVQIVSLAAIEILALLDTLAYWVSPFLFKLTILTSILYYLTHLLLMPKSISSKAHYVGKVMVVLFLLGHIALPYSIHLSSLVSQALTQEKRHSISSSLQQTHDELTSTKKSSSFKDHAESSLHYLKSISRKHVTHKVSMVSKHVFTSIALNIFDLLIMPGLLLFLLYKACIKIIPMNKLYSEVEGVIQTTKKDRIELEKGFAPIKNVMDHEKARFDAEKDHVKTVKDRLEGVKSELEAKKDLVSIDGMVDVDHEKARFEVEKDRLEGAKSELETKTDLEPIDSLVDHEKARFEAEKDRLEGTKSELETKTDLEPIHSLVDHEKARFEAEKDRLEGTKSELETKTDLEPIDSLVDHEKARFEAEKDRLEGVESELETKTGLESIDSLVDHEKTSLGEKATSLTKQAIIKI
ncbi:hypothetical protein [Marinomonas transparens]|uniref:Uncharacterized protein n=1 Tax=Marinomonas transparens TaxID=2795388 RepID=A0A934JMX3_9GAMM|nr:hypothetical protein [Marinomonas transparens]MBJ7536463.1 hypothetical protein [Marinomonas transparens]